jgi:hypothetical protein
MMVFLTNNDTVATADIVASAYIVAIADSVPD